VFSGDELGQGAHAVQELGREDNRGVLLHRDPSPSLRDPAPGALRGCRDPPAP
jgi:hypothetical protein